jgi:hypothetical protein
MVDRTQPAFVYVLGGASGPLKIGWSDDPAARLRALQGGHPVKLDRDPRRRSVPARAGTDGRTARA